VSLDDPVAQGVCAIASNERNIAQTYVPNGACVDGERAKGAVSASIATGDPASESDPIYAYSLHARGIAMLSAQVLELREDSGVRLEQHVFIVPPIGNKYVRYGGCGAV
jgi:hypothetical protein